MNKGKQPRFFDIIKGIRNGNHSGHTEDKTTGTDIPDFMFTPPPPPPPSQERSESFKEINDARNVLSDAMKYEDRKDIGTRNLLLDSVINKIKEIRDK